MSLVNFGVGFTEALKAARGGPLSVTPDDPTKPTPIDRKEVLEVLTQHPAFSQPPNQVDLREALHTAPTQQELEASGRVQRQRAIWRDRLYGCEPPDGVSQQDAAAIRAGWIAQTPADKMDWFLRKMVNPPIELINDGTYEQFCTHKGAFGTENEQRLFACFVQNMDLRLPEQRQMLRIFCSNYSQNGVWVNNQATSPVRNDQLILAIASLPDRVKGMQIGLHLDDAIYNELENKLSFTYFEIVVSVNPGQPAPSLDDVKRVSQFDHVKGLVLQNVSPAMALEAFQCATVEILKLVGRNEYRMPLELARPLLHNVQLINVSNETVWDALRLPRLSIFVLSNQRDVDLYSSQFKNCKNLVLLEFIDTDAGDATADACALLSKQAAVRFRGEHRVTPDGLVRMMAAKNIKGCTFRVRHGLTKQHVLRVAAQRETLGESANLRLEMTENQRNDPTLGFDDSLLHQFTRPNTYLKLLYLIKTLPQP
jgi:hypothetical protein